MGNILIWPSGARAEILAQCPTDRAKYLGLGSAVLITSSIAGISMGCATAMSLGLAVPVAVLSGAIWGLAIMLLDRWLVVSIQRRTNPWHNLIPVVSRLLLALLFSAVFSTPLVLQVFKPEIDAEIVNIQHEDYNQGIEQQTKGTVGLKIAGLQRDLAVSRRIVSTGGDAPTDPDDDPKIVSLKSQAAEQQKQIDKDYKDWQCQLYDKACKPNGPGPLATAKLDAYRNSQQLGDKFKQQIEDRKKELTSDDRKSRTTRVVEAKDDIGQIEQQLTALLDQQQSERDRLRKKTEAATGLLIRMKALDRVTQSNGSLTRVRTLLFLFILVIECLPIFVKLLMLFGPKSRYEQLEEQDAEARAGAASARIRKRQFEDLLDDDDDEIDKLLQGIQQQMTPPGETKPLTHLVPADGPHDPGDEDWENNKLINMRAQPTRKESAADLFPEEADFFDEDQRP